MATKVAPAEKADLDIKPMTGALGCEIFGVNLARLNDAEFAAIYQAFLDYSVLAFRDQDLTQADLANFGQRFGKLEDEPFIPNKAEHPGVYRMTGAGGSKLSTQYLDWHMDHSYQKNPSLGAILYAIDIPDTGGDTLFSSNYLAFESLSPAMQEFVSGLTAVHDVLEYGLRSGHLSIKTPEQIRHLAKIREKRPQIEHPLVCTHPETGRKVLYINNAWTCSIKELSQAEGNALLQMLNTHALHDRFKCRVRWQPKSVVMWDNRCVQHSPICDYCERRELLRVAIHSDWEPC